MAPSGEARSRYARLSNPKSLCQSFGYTHNHTEGPNQIGQLISNSEETGPDVKNSACRASPLSSIPILPTPSNNALSPPHRDSSEKIACIQSPFVRQCVPVSVDDVDFAPSGSVHFLMDPNACIFDLSRRRIVRDRARLSTSFRYGQGIFCGKCQLHVSYLSSLYPGKLANQKYRFNSSARCIKIQVCVSLLHAILVNPVRPVQSQNLLLPLILTY